MDLDLNKNNIAEKIKTVGKFIVKHKYVCSLIVFVLWIVFFDTTGYIYNRNLRKEVNNIRTEVDFYKKKTNENAKKLELLKNDSRSIEKLAREKYYFKKDNEDVFVIIDKTNE